MGAGQTFAEGTIGACAAKKPYSAKEVLSHQGVTSSQAPVGSCSLAEWPHERHKPRMRSRRLPPQGKKSFRGCRTSSTSVYLTRDFVLVFSRVALKNSNADAGI